MAKKMYFLSVFYSALLGVSLAFQCPIWRDILPCTCTHSIPLSKSVIIECEKMTTYSQVLDIFRGFFSPSDRIHLKLNKSSMQDLQYRAFAELNATIEELSLNHNHFDILNEDSFDGMAKVKYLSLADTPLGKLPFWHLWKKMPYIQTLDLGRTKIKEITTDTFRDLLDVKCVALADNQISRIDRNSFPPQIDKLHLARNRIYHLNDSLLELRNLRWLFLNENELEDLEGQLPFEAPVIQVIYASGNGLTKIPSQIKNYRSLDILFLYNNKIESLDGALAIPRAELSHLMLDGNVIRTITPENFIELDHLGTLSISHNQITSLNNSLHPLKSLEALNISYNLLSEFSFQEITGLQRLKELDLSYNQISQLTGSAANLVESNIKLKKLKLHHNYLETLNSALSGLSELLRLDLSYNKLRRISPDDFINLDQLRLLDISHNQLTTLEEMSKTYLPRLRELKASHNYLTILAHDFHGLPVLCNADLSSNQITALGRELVTKTRCRLDHIHEVYDVIKIYLQDNPILCDAALSEITSIMESNHAKIYGVSHCPPLSEQPVTSKPNAFLGYVPEPISPSPVPLLPVYNPPEYDSHILPPNGDLETPNQIQPKMYSSDPVVEMRNTNPYHTIDRLTDDDSAVIRQPRRDDPPVTIIPHNLIVTDPTPSSTTENTSSTTSTTPKPNVTEQTYDPAVQEQVINKLVSEIEELRTKIEMISTQNEMLLNKTVLATKVP
ncbi:insulin-like growth factor-binding protein complex acid labile subunit [Sitophilus oryzae]|uniref:Insulin-like growth factor-binding protein complex acid labile subunit n=1 Tax=Sitophilus oryzae TaxID=7048 RepID=A0A6J2XGJ6_SITOR|nr:insulin-like growth factor-binding protein complex acid labile subunit [Sitophilus oryzae]XP_030750403.1 insulin-like growth factor-binding protein complex acid labile subunit [Sitophilus oryzae]